mmetsp:Transcript_3484/g.6739  ORF Transcript_3484/g.6739 Transcript_3484/m.6739 type:complete len:1074 (-) Transcript_3484:1103-4324(-)
MAEDWGAGALELVLGVCVKVSEGQESSPTLCEELRYDFSCTGHESGEVKVYFKGVLRFLLIGHSDHPVQNVWLLPISGILTLVSLDSTGMTCFWDAENGLCLGKHRFARSVQGACTVRGRHLCIVPEIGSSIIIIDLYSRAVTSEVGGFCFTKVQSLEVEKSQVEPPLSKLGKSYLVVETCDYEQFFYDLEGRKFVFGKLLSPALHKWYSTLGEVNPVRAQFLKDCLLAQQRLKNKRPTLATKQYSSTGLLTTSPLDILATDPDTLCSEDLQESNAKPRPLEADALEKEVAGSLESEPSPELKSALVEQADAKNQEGGQERANSCSPSTDASKKKDPEGVSVRKQSADDEKACFVHQLGNSELFFALRANNTAVLQHAHELNLPSCSKHGTLAAFCFENNLVYLARPFSGTVLMYTIDPEARTATLDRSIPTSLANIDLLSMCPGDPERKCAVLDATLSRALVILWGSSVRSCVFLGSTLANPKTMSWGTPFRVDVGQLSFDVLSRRWGPLKPQSYDYEEEGKTEIERSDMKEPGRRLSLPRLPMTLKPSRARQNKTMLDPGVTFHEPARGLKTWFINVKKVTGASKNLFGLMSFFLLWGLDKTLDDRVINILGIPRPSHSEYRFVIDHKREKGMCSLLARNTERWTVSSKFTARQTLGLVALFIGLTASSSSLEEDQQAAMSSLVSHYGIVYPERLIKGGRYTFPCFDVLTQFALSRSSSQDIPIAARLLLQVCIERMPDALRISRAAEWAGRLHMSKGLDLGSVLVIGILGCVNPEDLAPSTARLVASSLRRLIPKRQEVTAIAAELLARGFFLYCPYLEADLPSLIRDLVLEQSDEMSPACTASQQALIEIGAAKPLLLIETVGQVALLPGMHRAALLALSTYVKKRPATLVRILPTVVEIIIKTLDPSESEIRKRCLKFSTIVLHQLVKRFPMTSFQQETQRFAVGTVESSIIIYDLRTATKWRILEGHQGPVSALAFGVRSGDSIMSYSAAESMLRYWKTGGNSGFFSGLLGFQGSCLAAVLLPPIAGVDKVSPSDAITTIAMDATTLIREDGSAIDLASQVPGLARR